MKQSDKAFLNTWKLHPRFTPIAFSLYMASIMAFLMSLLITAANSGIEEAYLARVWHAYQIAMPSAFICVLAVRPLVTRLVQWTVQDKSNQIS